jgi:hypothetical protein
LEDITMRHVRSVGSAFALVVGLASMVIVGCAGNAVPSGSATITPSPAASSAPSATASPTSSPTQPSGPLTIRRGSLPAGTYTTTAFEPTLHFRLNDGWSGVFPDHSDEIAFHALEVTGFMAITRVTKVVDRTGTISVPDDLIGWLAANPNFSWSGKPVAVTVGGVTGAMLDGSVKTGTDVFAYDTSNMRIVTGDHIRYHVLPLDGPDLTIVLAGPGGDDGFEAALLDSAQATIDSLEIVGR